MSGPAVVVLADDLIWSTRLAAAVRAAGGMAVSVRTLTGLEGALEGGDRRVIVDLTARAYDATAAVALARAHGANVIAVGPHDDEARRTAARAAGASRVLAYRAVADDGGRAIATWLRPPMSALAASTVVPAARYRERIAAARELIREEHLAALLVGVGPDLRYLVGYDALPLERLTMLVLRPGDEPPKLVVPRLEADPAGRAPAVHGGLVEIATWEETDDAHGIVADLVARPSGRPARSDGPTRDRSIAVTDTLWASHLLRLQAALTGRAFTSGGSVMSRLRIVKDADEIDLLRQAARAADRVVDAVAAGRLVGRTEREVAREVEDRLIDEGHDRAAFAIVGSGPNSASPHHAASDRRIVAGDPIVLDIGGTLGGYGSDVTRVLWVTGGPAGVAPSTEFTAAHAVLTAGQAAARAAVRPGAICEAIDGAARSVIAEAGYGDLFIHRAGHGIGLEAHEEPYIVAGSTTPLRPGMAFSIEPGIYRPGLWGMRLEDIVVCTSAGSESLNRTDRALRVVDGR